MVIMGNVIAKMTVKGKRIDKLYISDVDMPGFIT